MTDPTPPAATPEELCGEKNNPGSHPCNAPKGHAPGPEDGGHYCRYEWFGAPAATRSPEPLTPEEEADLRRDIAAGGRGYGDWYVMRLLATLDAARATASVSDDVREMLVRLLDEFDSQGFDGDRQLINVYRRRLRAALAVLGAGR